MASKQRLSTKLSRHGLTRQMEAFCHVVVNEELEPTAAVERVYSETSYPSSSGTELMRNPKITRRIEQLQERRDLVATLNRSELTADAVEIAGEAREAGKFSAGVSALRLAADLQGLTTSNPVAEATASFLAFLSGNQVSGNEEPAVGDVRVLDS